MKAIVDQSKEQSRERFIEVYNLCKKKKICAKENEEDDEVGNEDEDFIPKEPPHKGCGRYQPTIRCIGLQLTAVWKKIDRLRQPNKIILTPDQVWKIFKEITDDECIILGRDPKFARPEWMILSVLQVPPPVMRPTVISGSGGCKQDDLTMRLANVVRANNTLRASKQSNQKANIINENTRRLQYQVASYIDGDSLKLKTATKQSGSQMESIKGRLYGNKNSRFFYLLILKLFCLHKQAKKVAFGRI